MTSDSRPTGATFDGAPPKTVVIVFSGFNQRAVTALLRTLRKNEIAYGVVAISPDDPIFSTVYGDGAVVRAQRQLDLEDIATAIGAIQRAQPADSYLVAPSSEALNRFLLTHRRRLEAMGCVIPLPGIDLYERLSDKLAFTQLCRDHGILVPGELDDLTEADLPCVAKPRRYLSSDGVAHSPILVHDEADRRAFLEQRKVADFYYQEFVPGDSYYLLYYRYADGRIDKLSQQNLIQQAGGKSILAAVTSHLHEETVSSLYEELLASCGFRGLVMIEVRQNGRGFWMIEANPRMWGPSQLFVDAGLDLFESLLLDYGVLGGRPASTRVEARYFWGSGMPPTSSLEHSVAWHGYSHEAFRREAALWQAADIYDRSDTEQLHALEKETLGEPA